VCSREDSKGQKNKKDKITVQAQNGKVVFFYLCQCLTMAEQQACEAPEASGTKATGATMRAMVEAHMPIVPFKGLSKFYDIGPLFQNPVALHAALEIIAHHLAVDGISVDVIAGVDARGFVLGAALAVHLKKPFAMVRKVGKLPNAVTSDAYLKEYAEGHGADQLCMQKGSIKPGQHVLVVDDVVATGGTLAAAVQVVTQLGGVVSECCCLAHIAHLGAAGKVSAPIWAVVETADE
jgi:adenine phosphoribosyltransferase